ncbi:MAG TPA: D-glycero-beta-D-manno-heptose-7-phosphate kinase [Xanthobacteraceae bacterium]|nr:D-glycero-beta-D-manno-heptose-7-phosphate kinase [Xanthobacteraceae bacterium]
MFDFDLLSAEFSNQTVLCIGDLMRDEFVYGDVSRISPEAPTPVIAVRRSESNIGGAGNVARGVAALGARCIFIGVIGEDDAGRLLRADLAGIPAIEPVLVVASDRPTTRKVRFVSDHFSTHMLRADWEVVTAIDAELEQRVVAAIEAALPRADIVLLSDYAKGVLTPRVIRAAIEGARRLGKRIVVDPKSANFDDYRGATVLTPNHKEFVAATRKPSGTTAEIVALAHACIGEAEFEAVLITRSEQGATLVSRDGSHVHAPAFPVRVRDVSGAGDTIVAALAVTLAAGADWETALRLSNAAAAVAVSKTGTATVSADEMRKKILPPASLAAEQKIALTREALNEQLADWRAEGLRVGFTNGCFDILHPGHVRVITQARAACDRLVLGLNSDASVRRLKGPERPVQTERARAEVLAAMEAVDLVVIFDEDTPLELIKAIKPNVLVKGSDYSVEQVVGHDVVTKHGGSVVLVDLLPGFSTTAVVERTRVKRL